MEPASLTIGPNPVNQGQTLEIRLFNEYKDSLNLLILGPDGREVMNRDLSTEVVVLQRVATSGWRSGDYSIRISGGRIQAERHIIIQ